MDKDQVIAKLREHEAELRAAGAEQMSIFGSVARGEATDESDLDVLVTFSEPVIQSGWGFFTAVEELRALIVGITGVSSVDIVPEPLRRKRSAGVWRGIGRLPTKRPLIRFRDIVENGQSILEYTHGMDFAAYSLSKITRDASKR
jgi:predicted nucleotidyltransferase